MSFGPFKKDLTPLSKGGAIHKHAGKGHAPFQAPPPGPGGRNDFSKPPMPAAPAAPAVSPMPAAPMMNPAQSGGPGQLGGI